MSAGIRQRRICLDETDCEGIMKLMNSGFSLQDTMILLKNRKNQKCFEEIEEHLKNGEETSKFFSQYCPKEYLSCFSSFLSYLPFLQSLSLSISAVRQERNQKKEYRKGLIYPCVLFIGVLFGILVFNEYCLPPLMNLMDGFHLDTSFYQNIRIGIRILTVCLLFSVLMLSLTALFFMQKKNQVNGYKLMSRFFPGSIFCQYASGDFVRFFLECVRLDIHTRQSFEILCSLSEKPLTVFLSETVRDSLEKGQKMEQAVENPYLDPVLARFFRIAVYSQDMQNMLEGYLTMSEERTRKQCRRITRTIQAVSYCTIGSVLILVYQILMLPLSILSQI